jgi:deoxyhypusine synthase
MPYRAPGSPQKQRKAFLSGKPIRYYRPKGAAAVRTLIDEGFQAFNAARLGEACRIFADKMLAREHDTTIALTIAGAMTPAGIGGCVIAMMQRGLVDFVISTGANLYHDLHYALNFTLRRGSPFVDDRICITRSAATCCRFARAVRNIPSSPARRSTACPSTPPLPATARSA